MQPQWTAMSYISINDELKMLLIFVLIPQRLGQSYENQSEITAENYTDLYNVKVKFTTKKQ